jgi:hypothetical protein
MLHLRAEVGDDLAQLERYRDAARRASRRYGTSQRGQQARREWLTANPDRRRVYEDRRIEKIGRDEYNRRKREQRRQRESDPAYREQQQLKEHKRYLEIRDARAASAPLCACGCGERTTGGRTAAKYKRGHWAKTSAGRANAAKMGRDQAAINAAMG